MEEFSGSPTKKESGPSTPEAQKYFEKLKSLWQKERKEGDPKIKFELVFAPHLVESDLDRTKQEFSDCDIYIPEMVGWGPNTDRVHNDLTSGLASPKQVEEDTASRNPDYKKHPNYAFNSAVRKMLHRSRKAVTIIDIPKHHPLIDTDKAEADFFAHEVLRSKTLEEKIANVKKFLLAMTSFQAGRDAYMLEQIPKKIREILDRKTELKKKEPVKVLISLGANHTPVYFYIQSLVEPGLSHRSFSADPFVYGLLDEAQRRVQFGENVDSLSEVLLARAALETEVLIRLEKSHRAKSEIMGTSKVIKLIRDIISQFSTDEIRLIFEEVQKNRKFRDVFLEVCENKGIKVGGF